MISSDLIQCFVDIARLGSLAAAARHRQVSPSNISRQLGELEGALGVRLFQRTTRSLTLTHAGELYLEHVQPLLLGLDRAAALASAFNDQPHGVLRISTTSVFAQLYFSSWLPLWFERYPQVSVELILDAHYTDLVSAQVDLALRLGPVDWPGMVVRHLCALPRCVVAAPSRLDLDRPQNPAALSTLPTLVYPAPHDKPRWWFKPPGQPPFSLSLQARVTAADGLLLRALASQGVGYALLPRWLCAHQLVSGDLVEVFPEYIASTTGEPASIYLLYPTKRHLPLKVRAFVDFLCERFAQDPQWSEAVEL